MAIKFGFILLIFCIFTKLTYGVVSESAYEWAEPNGPVGGNPQKRLSRDNSKERLDALRNTMKSHNPPIDACVIPTSDAHNSQYIAPSDARREWISGLSGSSGTAVVTADYALMWTDGRYFTQFEVEVDTDLWTLMRMGTDVTIQTWLSTNLTEGEVVGIDPTTYTRSSWNNLQGFLTPVGVKLEPTSYNLVDLAREIINDPVPARPSNDLLPLEQLYTGQSAGDKVRILVEQMKTRGATALVLTALDDIAYTLNLRGSDIPYNPVFFAYLVIKLIPNNERDSVATLFWNRVDLPLNIQQHLSKEGVSLQRENYSEIFKHLSQYADSLSQGSSVWLSQDASEALHRAALGTIGRTNIISTLSPVALLKCFKNDVELAGFKNAHIKDGIAVVRFLRWLHEEVDAGRPITEMDASKKLIEYRSDETLFEGPSFPTIAGAGENGAIIHYKPSEEGEQRVIKPDDMFLVDSGAQYWDGTTDITRTRHMSSNPTDFQRLAFTRVLKGQILLATAVFPQGSGGHILDILARKSLWDVGLNYNHGTGHGVGHFLNVHEGPSGIGSGAMGNDPGIFPGMIFSNEPGYYEVGEFGIRHEDLVEVISMSKDADHIYAKDYESDFHGRGAVAFHTISLAPHQTACLNISLLTPDEIKYLNDYHARVLSTLGPLLLQRGLEEDYEWLKEECAPITSGVTLFKSTPMLAMFSFLLVLFK